jgi:hypothetical protein
MRQTVGARVIGPGSRPDRHSSKELRLNTYRTTTGIVVLAAALAVGGCGADKSTVADTQAPPPPPPVVPVVPPPPEVIVPTGPFKVPPTIPGRGASFADNLADLKNKIRDACGGDLCVNIATGQDADSDLTRCQFVRTEPDAGTLIERKGTIVAYSGAEPCKTDDTDDDNNTNDDNNNNTNNNDNNNTNNNDNNNTNNDNNDNNDTNNTNNDNNDNNDNNTNNNNETSTGTGEPGAGSVTTPG